VSQTHEAETLGTRVRRIRTWQRVLLTAIIAFGGAVGLWLVIAAAYPGLWSYRVSGAPWRLAGIGLALAALGAGAWLYRRGRPYWTLVGMAHLLTFWYLTFEVTAAFDAAHNGEAAGHESLAVAGTWGLYGLGLALAGRRWPYRHLRHGARLVLAAALVFLTLGGLLANARWAQPPYRAFAFAAVLGGTWAAEWLLGERPEDDDVPGLLSLMAAFGGFFVAAFEVARWLEPVFTRPTGTPITAELLAWERALKAFWNATAWSLYALAVMGAGSRLRSARTRLLAMAGFYWALLYVAVFGLTNLAAPAWLRGLAFVAAVPGALAARCLQRRAKDQPAGWERLAAPFLPWAAIAVAVAWVSFEWLSSKPR
jgi:hypothetical protein